MRSGTSVTEREFFKDRFSRSEVMALLRGQSPRDVFSFKSPTFKARGLDPDTLTDDQLVGLLVDEPRFFRRPVAVVNGRLIAGASARVLADIIG